MSPIARAINANSAGAQLRASTKRDRCRGNRRKIELTLVEGILSKWKKRDIPGLSKIFPYESR